MYIVCNNFVNETIEVNFGKLLPSPFQNLFEWDLFAASFREADHSLPLNCAKIITNPQTTVDSSVHGKRYEGMLPKQIISFSY